MSAPTIASETGLLKPQTYVDCRVYARHGSDLETSCQPVAARGDEDLKWAARVRDVSLGGIGLILSRRFERGAGLAIEIPETVSEPGYTVLARVVRVAPMDGKWLLGCRFLSELSEDGLKAILHSAKPCTPPAKIASPPEAKAVKPQKAYIANVHLEVSLGDGKFARRFVKRLTLTGPWPYVRDSLVKGQAGRGTDPKLPFQLKVRSCVQEGKGWILRCKFAEPPSPLVLRLFGYKGGRV